MVTVAAIGALCVEGVLVLLSGGNCPLGPLLRKLGDETPFFELFLPPRAAKLAIPILAAVCVLGAVLKPRKLCVSRKTVLVSDPSGKEIAENDGAKVRITFADARRGAIELDVTAEEAKAIGAQGRQVARRGRKPKTS
jgi:hypothetical protein